MRFDTFALESDGAFGQFAVADGRDNLTIDFDGHIATLDLDFDPVELSDWLAGLGR